MSIQLKIGLAGDAYRNGSPRLAIALLREAADMIQAYLPREISEEDENGLKEHQESRVDDVRYEDLDDRD